MRQYLAEGLTGAFPFIVDRTKATVTESRPDGQAYHRIPGRFSVCDCVNGNNRRYSRRVWEKNLEPGSTLQEAIKKSAAFGLLEHPKDGLVTLESPISHQVVRAELVESKGPDGKPVYEVFGEIALYNTPEGQKLKALIEGGYNPLVSSRGYGTLTKGADGVDEVMEDYVCESWDVVIKPSFASAELVPARSGTTARMAPPVAPNPTAESVKAPAAAVGTTESLRESKPSTGPSNGPAASNVNTHRIMELTEIKAQINALRSLDPSKPQRFAESMGTVEALHQEVATWASADNKRSWEAQKLHRELDALSEGFTSRATAPVKEVKRLTEQNTKLLKVVNAVAQTAVTYKKKLGESVKSSTSSRKLAEELTRRGQGWQRLAESRKAKYAKLEADFDTACEALDLMAKRYHEDTTEMGRRLLVFEFKEKAQDPAIQKQLKEATRLRHLAKIRESLEGPKDGKNSVSEADALKKPAEGEAPSKEGIKDGKAKGAGSPEAGKVADAPGKVTNESGTAGKPAALTEHRIVDNSRDIRGLDESVNLVKRLSGSAK